VLRKNHAIDDAARSEDDGASAIRYGTILLVESRPYDRSPRPGRDQFTVRQNLLPKMQAK
jgi:hypothetical protein